MSNTQNSSGPILGIIEILIKVKSTVNPKTDVVWAGYDTPDQLRKMIDWRIEMLENGDFEYISDLIFLFAPTGTFQELSLSNGWGDEFLVLAEEFDRCYKKFRSE